MESKTVSMPLQSSGQISAFAEIERTRSSENERTTKLVAQKYLGRIYNRNTNRSEEIAVEKFSDQDLVTDQSEFCYIATLDSVKDKALTSLSNNLGFDITATVGSSVPIKIEAGLDASRTKTELSDSSTVFCTVACVKKDRCQFQQLPQRRGVKTTSYNLGIIKSILVYAGYRIVLEIISCNDKSDKKTNIDVKAKGSTLASLFGAGIHFAHGSKSLANRTIEQINIKEIFSFGGYRVPSMKIPGNDFPKIQGMFEEIRRHFGINYYSIIDRLVYIHPTEDLVPLTEIATTTTSPLSIPPLAISPILHFNAKRGAGYYKILADEIISSLPVPEWKNLEAELIYQKLDFGRMLHALEISFLHLRKKLPEEGDGYVLLVGQDSTTTGQQRIQLMKPQNQTRFPKDNRIVDQALSLDIHSDIFDDQHRVISGVNIYDRILETPILASNLPKEFNICLGVATEFMISRFAPQKIVVCLPRDFFQFSTKPLEEFIRKLTDIYTSLSHIVRDPSLANRHLLFIMNDQQSEQISSELEPQKIRDEIISGAKSLSVERTKRSGGNFFSVVTTMLGINPKSKVEIEDAIDAYMFIVNHFKRSSEVSLEFLSKPIFNPNFLNSTKMLALEDILSIEKDLESPVRGPHSRSRERSSLSEGVEFGIDYLRSGKSGLKESLAQLGIFDKDNITLNSITSFRRVLTTALRYMRYIESAVLNLEGQFLTSSQLLKSVERILNLLRKKEIESIDQVEAEKILGDTIAEEIKQYAIQKRTKDDEIKVNQKEIEEKTLEVKQWEEDKTPTPITLKPNEPILGRRGWHIPPFGKDYIFDARMYDFSDCKFSKTPGSFNCNEAEFKQTKKAVFTPKYYGYFDDYNVCIQVDVKKCDHPDTQRDIANHKGRIEVLNGSNASLNKQLNEIVNVIREFEARQIKELERRLVSFKQELATLNMDLQKSQSKLNQHYGYYEVLKEIYSIHFNSKNLQEIAQEQPTNYYKLLPTIGNFIPDVRDSWEKGDHPRMESLSKQYRRPIYVITPGNQKDWFCGNDYVGDPLFFEYDGYYYIELQLGLGQKPKEVATAIQEDVTKKKKELLTKVYFNASFEKRLDVRY